MGLTYWKIRFATITCVYVLFFAAAVKSPAARGHEILVSNEKSGDLTVISGGEFKVMATIPAGKRPRGIHANPDGKTISVALSGTPIEPPPKPDANGNPMFEKGHDDDDADNAESDKKADGVGMRMRNGSIAGPAAAAQCAWWIQTTMRSQTRSVQARAPGASR
jgi:YVTN family beta-propeller protein